ncbi:hypothetical protein NQ318_005881 [Aromia moschata]|uniref:Uncharacterized protein n=1 Tax=Aromia moschata TaxID=1265417 RepID=A0AAV8YSB3_9CUCU|nr:hypothetical protein NQ318_005881 [Aromia moschata]
MVYLTKMHKIPILQMIGYGDTNAGRSCSPISRKISAVAADISRYRIVGENIIGPFFIDGNLNGETYLALLQSNVVPTMANLYPAEGNSQLSGGRGSVEWPARSPDVTPLNFFLWSTSTKPNPTI